MASALSVFLKLVDRSKCSRCVASPNRAQNIFVFCHHVLRQERKKEEEKDKGVGGGRKEKGCRTGKSNGCDTSLQKGLMPSYCNLSVGLARNSKWESWHRAKVCSAACCRGITACTFPVASAYLMARYTGSLSLYSDGECL